MPAIKTWRSVIYYSKIFVTGRISREWRSAGKIAVFGLDYTCCSIETTKLRCSWLRQTLFNFGLTGVFVFSSYISRMSFGSGTGAILFDDVTCDGTETSLQAPSCLRYSNPEYCSHSSDVGVWCDRLDSSGECYSHSKVCKQ